MKSKVHWYISVILIAIIIVLLGRLGEIQGNLNAYKRVYHGQLPSDMIRLNPGVRYSQNHYNPNGSSLCFDLAHNEHEDKRIFILIETDSGDWK